MDYPGKVITKTQVTPTQTSASGNWTLDDQAAAIKNNNWPVALVPNPISKSLRFNSADSAYLNRTPASAGNRKTWTWSGWFKTVAQGGNYTIISTGSSGNYTQVLLTGSQLSASAQTSSSYTLIQNSSALFRDPSAWYHFVWAVDTTQATAANRSKMYINGTQIAIDGSPTYPSQNADLWVNAAAAHFMGQSFGSSNYFSGYLTEVNFIDGQALTPSSFGMTNPQTGQWIPLKYSGTYGTNGFYLNFKDATSTTTLGYDYSGNANNWTTNNFSVTAGAGNDSLTDVPTPWFAYNTTGDVGGVIRGNYCVVNAIGYRTTTPTPTITNGNLDVVCPSGTLSSIGTATFGVSSGKWYWEVTKTGTAYGNTGIVLTPFNMAANSSLDLGALSNEYVYVNSGLKFNNNSSSAYGASWTNNDVIGVALDLDAGTLVFYKNGSSQGTAFSSLPSGIYLVGGYDSFNGSGFVFNFGQRPFAYTPPTGFRSLCTTNLPATAIGFGLTNQGDDYFNAVLYTGNGSYPRTITGVGFQPDLVWVKARPTTYSHIVYDAVRGTGTTKNLSTNETDAEGFNSAYANLTAFASDGFTVDTTSGTNVLNNSGTTFVAWNWKASGSTVSNTAGTITSTVSANTTAGFSVVTYTTTGSAGTVGHGLGVAPSMIILKNRSGAADDWYVYHASLGNTKYLTLNTTATATTAATWWNSTSPTSTVFSLGSAWSVVKNYVAYCFAAVPGYSAFGSYIGNSSADGTFVYTGFRPKFLLFKNSTGADNWYILDSARNTYNVCNARIFPNLSSAEDTLYVIVDFLSNGFKFRSNDASWNSSSYTYIYAAFAEAPFQFANAR